MDVNRISGYIPGKIVFFLMQVCKAGVARMRKIWLTRHGESVYNMTGKIGGDSGLSPRGEIYASLLPDVLVDRVPLVRNTLLLECCGLRRFACCASNMPWWCVGGKDKAVHLRLRLQCSITPRRSS